MAGSPEAKRAYTLVRDNPNTILTSDSRPAIGIGLQDRQRVSRLNHELGSDHLCYAAYDRKPTHGGLHNLKPITNKKTIDTRFDNVSPSFSPDRHRTQGTEFNGHIEVFSP